MRRPSPKSRPLSLYPDERGFHPRHKVVVGGVLFATDQIEYNANRPTRRLTVRNTGDRPIQVGSHYHFFEVNRYLSFDRSAAFGHHLNIPATTAIRFEPGDSREVELVPYAGKQRITGFSALVEGYAGCENEPSFYPVRERAIRRAQRMGFLTDEAAQPVPSKSAESSSTEPAAKAPRTRRKQTEINETEKE